MSVTHVADVSDSGNTADLDIASVALTAGDLMVITIACGDGDSVDDIDWGSDLDAFTLVPNTIATNAGRGNSEIWAALGLTAGTRTVSIHMSGSGQIGGGASTFNDADFPTDGAAEDADAQASPQAIIVANVTDDDYMIDAIMSQTNITPGGGQTEIFSFNLAGQRREASHQDGASDSGDGEMEWTYLGNSDIAHSACRIPMAAGGTTPKGPLGKIFHGPFAGPIS